MSLLPFRGVQLRIDQSTTAGEMQVTVTLDFMEAAILQFKV
jgi:hypothetical protein